MAGKCSAVFFGDSLRKFNFNGFFTLTTKETKWGGFVRRCPITLLSSMCLFYLFRLFFFPFLHLPLHKLYF